MQKLGQLDLLNHINGTFFCPPEELPGAWEFYVGVTALPSPDCLFASLVAQGNDTRVSAYEYI